MTLEEKMFAEIAKRRASGLTKREFLIGKDYKEAKFDYWLLKSRSVSKVANLKFQEVDFSEEIPSVKGYGKIMEIETPSGFRITVFA